MINESQFVKERTALDAWRGAGVQFALFPPWGAVQLFWSIFIIINDLMEGRCR